MISEAAFAALVWGSVAVVLAVFAYETYLLASDAGWIDPERPEQGDRQRHR